MYHFPVPLFGYLDQVLEFWSWLWTGKHPWLELSNAGGNLQYRSNFSTMINTLSEYCVLLYIRIVLGGKEHTTLCRQMDLSSALYCNYYLPGISYFPVYITKPCVSDLCEKLPSSQQMNCWLVQKWTQVCSASFLLSTRIITGLVALDLVMNMAMRQVADSHHVVCICHSLAVQQPETCNSCTKWQALPLRDSPASCLEEVLGWWWPRGTCHVAVW